VKDQLKQAIIDGNADTVNALTQALLASGASAREILEEALLPGMDVVGQRMRDGECFIPEVLLSARTMQGALDLLKPHLAEGEGMSMGTVVIGTVEGDLHDIGKNLVGMMCEGAGFEVIDIGFNVDPEAFVEAIKKHQPQVVGMSAMLTTTMRAMGHTIKAIEEAGLRDTVKIMVGGAPVDAEFGKRVGADGYGSNAPAGSELAQKFVGAA